MIGRSFLVAMILAVALNLYGDNPRIKDISDLRGNDRNVISGIGLVIGLNGTGSGSLDTLELASNLYKRKQVRLEPSQIKSKNIAAVYVQAEIVGTAYQSQKINVTVSAIDDTKSLLGGTLVESYLTGVDRKVYSIASGKLIINGFNASADGASATKNHPTVGKIPNGGTIVRKITSELVQDGHFQILLSSPDTSTAIRVVDAINEMFPDSASALNPGSVKVHIPPQFVGKSLRFISLVQAMRVEPDNKATIIVNEKTGVVVIGSNVKLDKVSIASANLTITTTESPQVSQPAPLSNGETVVVPRSELNVVEGTGRLQTLPNATTVGDLADAFNALGLTPRDLMSVLQELKRTGALHAEIIVE